MKILYIATSFPKPCEGATIYTDLAESLHTSGHNITVAVSEQTKSLNQTEIKKERGFDVLRIVTGNYYDVSIIEKGITTIRIPILMKRGIIKCLSNKKFDFILYESPPVTNANLVKWAKRNFDCPSYLMLKDIFPQNAVDIGILKRGNPIYKYFSNKEKQLYESADIIGCMSKENRKYLLHHNPSINQDKVEVFPNTKKITNDYLPEQLYVRKEHSIPKKACIFLFGGNMGKPQYVDLLCEAVIDFKNDESIFFLFVGRGTERYKLEDIIKDKKINNAIIIENLPRNEYEQLIKECDVGLIILDPRFTIPNYPSRILSYMEYAKPVLAATDKVTDLKQLIQDCGCGEWVCSEDKKDFIDAIKRMSKSQLREGMGRNGRNYIQKKFDIKKSVQILEKHFNTEKR